MSQVAHDAGHGVMGADDAVWLARIRADIDNMRAAIGWALDSDEADDQELALSILAPLSWISQNCSDLAFDLLATRAAPLAEDAEPSLRTPVLTLAGYHYWQQGDLEQARAFVERAIDAGIVTDLINPLDPYVMLVAIEMTAGNHVRAFEALEAARVHFDDTECKADVARALGGFATFEAMAGRIDAALADSEHAMQLAQSSGNLQFLANVLNGRAWALQRDDPEGALEVAEEFVAIYRRVGVARSVAPGLFALVAGLRARLGDDEGAFRLLRDAVVIARDDGTLPAAAATLGFALTPFCRTGRPEVAAVLLGALDRGALAQVAKFPGAHDARARTRSRIDAALGDEQTEVLVERGAAMTYDDAIGYALDELADARLTP